MSEYILYGIAYGTESSLNLTKDYIEKIDFQDIFIAVLNWPISELYGAFVCIMHYLDLTAGCWVSVDFDLKYKILLGETWAHGEPIHEEEKSSKQEST